ncbi:unnamed protein product, partial [Schistosoma mattheei]
MFTVFLCLFPSNYFIFTQELCVYPCSLLLSKQPALLIIDCCSIHVCLFLNLMDS